MTELALEDRPPRSYAHDARRRILRSETVVHNKVLRPRARDREDVNRLRSENYWGDNPRLISERQLKNRASRAADANLRYPKFWVTLAVVGIIITAIGFIVGVVVPGALTGLLFPIGVTILLLVAYGARKRTTI